MPSDEHSPRHPPTPQSIPLQTLSRPPDIVITPRRDRDHSDSLPSSRTRALLGSRRTFTGRVNTHGRYEGVLAGTSRDADSIVPHITTPRTPHFDDPGSPVNAGDFQSAVGGLGLSLSPTESPLGISPLGPILEDAATTPYTAGASSVEGDDYFATTSDDRAPLTDSRYLQPISGSHLPDAEGQRHDRNRKRHNSYTRSPTGEGIMGSGRHLAARSINRVSQLSVPSLSRSSAASSPIGSAGSMIRRMSQRVVNLSYEPDPVASAPTIRKSVAPSEGVEPFTDTTEYISAQYMPSVPPLEKAPPLNRVGEAQYKWQQSTNPLRGRSLGIFGPDSKLRSWLCEILVHPITEPIILVLIVIQTVLLAVQAAPSIQYMGQSQVWGSNFTDYAFLVLFAIYSLELSAKIIVSGFVKNADEYSTLKPGITVWQAFYRTLRSFVLPENSKQTFLRKANVGFGDHQTSIVRTFRNFDDHAEVRGHGRQAQRIRLARRAFLRHSFNRIDLLAVLSFWISFFLAITKLSSQKHMYVFQMLSCLRILRLLNLTNGTSIILRSLKKAAPLLVNVFFLVTFFWLLFAIVGIQSFKSSFRRTCVWYGDTTADILQGNHSAAALSTAYAQDLAPGNVQFCGGFTSVLDGRDKPYVMSDFSPSNSTYPKGYICPERSICVEGLNPYNNTLSFDNIVQAMEIVFVVMSSNTFTDLLYYTTASDSLGGAFFFAFSFFILSLWLLNLLIAVITSSFQIIREENSTSAFTTNNQVLTVEEEQEGPRRKKTPLKKLFDYTYWFWIILIVISLISPSTASVNSSQQQLDAIRAIEAAVTLLLLVEIFLRFIVDWRNFHRSPRNWVDLGIAVITSVIQIPPIRNSGQPYAWLTFFQIVRVYRVVLAVPLTRDLIMIVLGNVSGLLNLIVFVFLVCFLAAIFAVQLYRGAIPQFDADTNVVRITFANIYNAFIGMYQVFSSENWTTVMYEATTSDANWNTAWIDALFFIIWFAFANFIILNMFIAVIQENFDVSEDEKRLHQVKAFLQQKELTGSTPGSLSLATLFRLGREKTRHKDPIDYGPATIEMFKGTVVVEFLEEQMEEMEDQEAGMDGVSPKQPHLGFWASLQRRVLRLVWGSDPNPFYTSLTFSRPYDQLDPRTMAREMATAAEERKKAQRQYLQRHPNYNKALFIFDPYHPVRTFCQKLVGPGRGSRRIEGVDPVKSYWYTFSAIIYIAILGMVVVACVATPLYQRDYFQRLGGYTNHNWLVWTDMAFAGIFTLEALVKIIADGFFFTPNAYYRGSWGFIDAVVLITLWISIGASLANLGQISRSVGAVKAIRALRLLNVSDSARGIFHSVIIKEGWKLLSAAFVSLSLLIPFAIWGLNLFRGQFTTCNDSSYLTLPGSSLADCVVEYGSTPYYSNWTVWAPRQSANPYYSFDDFGSSLFILFQIVSQEGWIDVMWSAMSATGIGNVPNYYASQGNAIFFIIFNLLGAVFVLTLFISVFMRNYTEQTGVAFLTAEQRSWLELRKLLLQVSPSKRPSASSTSRFKNWCYRNAVSKHGGWSRFITLILILHLILLILEWYPEPDHWVEVRDGIFIFFMLILVVNIVIRFVGLSWKRFRRNSWDIYSLIAVSGSLITTILDTTPLHVSQPVIRQVHKYFLVAIALLLIPRNNQLDQLFKTAAASLSAIGNLLLTWLVLYLVFAIAMTQTLGLTRFASSESANLNFRTVPKALILLFRMSCGEGWNQIMTDFANVNPPLCTDNGIFFESDCGSRPWAFVLFIAWNLISMYIFVSLFVSLIFESFSYVYQQSSGLSVVSREEIRRFKQAWATFDPDGTGFISKEAFPRLLGELSGLFEMRVYDGEHSVGQILEACRVDNRSGEETPGVMYGIDIAALNRKLNTIDINRVRRRRQQLNVFSQEVLVSADADRGIAFSSCLMILAHYKVITDSKALRLEEFLRRRYRLQRVEEEVRRRIVIGFFDTLFWSRQFRHRKSSRDSARMVDIPQFAVPEIYIDAEDDDGPGVTPLMDEFSGPRTPTSPRSPGASLDISPRRMGSTHSSNLEAFPTSPDGSRGRGYSFGTSPPRSIRSSPSLHASRPSHDLAVPDMGLDGWHSRQSSEQQLEDRVSFEQRPSLRVSTTGFESQGPGPVSTTRHRRQQSSQGSAQLSALDAFDNSAWGESIKRSFTVGRKGARSRRRLDNLPRMDE